jgi:hypothetical protein
MGVGQEGRCYHVQCARSGEELIVLVA